MAFHRWFTYLKNMMFHSYLKLPMPSLSIHQWCHKKEQFVASLLYVVLSVPGIVSWPFGVCVEARRFHQQRLRPDLAWRDSLGISRTAFFSAYHKIVEEFSSRFVKLSIVMHRSQASFHLILAKNLIPTSWMLVIPNPMNTGKYNCQTSHKPTWL